MCIIRPYFGVNRRHGPQQRPDNLSLQELEALVLAKRRQNHRARRDALRPC
jgi:hypothetical protein